MYICQGHFLAPHVIVVKDGLPLGRLVAVDTDLMVAERLVGFDSETGEPLTDLVKVEQVVFKSDIPPGLKDLLPTGTVLVELKSE